MVSEFDIGLVGLGSMGRNLALNFADHGFAVAGYDLDSDKIDALNNEAGEGRVRGVNSLADLVACLKEPRAMMIMVPAGQAVDQVIGKALVHLHKGDLIIDAGNSHYKDSDDRSERLSMRGIHFLGLGISGGEAGARHGPSMMLGGNADAYERIRPLFEAAAARVDGEPCVKYLGRGSAGHYVKMVHNGIEYAMMELIAETYYCMRHALRLGDDRLHETYEQWNQGEAASYLLEITSHIFTQPDRETSMRLIDVILDQAKQKGTGKWTCQDAMDLKVPVPTIDAAVWMRDLSGCKQQRAQGAELFGTPPTEFSGDSEGFIEKMRTALYASMVVSYAQGMALLSEASNRYNYGINLSDVARIWRGGCIIRSALLEKIRETLEKNSDLANPMFAPNLTTIFDRSLSALREICKAAIGAGIAAPAFMASLAYFDAFRSAWLPANLIQAQRDYFGSHTYERIDKSGSFHTDWNAR